MLTVFEPLAYWLGIGFKLTGYIVRRYHEKIRWVISLLVLTFAFTASAESARDAQQGDTVQLRKAAEQGNVDAQLELGWMYENGKGVPQDYKEAITWYRKAAEQGDADGQLFLGMMYLEGKGVPRNLVLAYMLFNLAAVEGDDVAVDLRNFTEKQMTPAQIEKAQGLSRQWKVGTPFPTSSK
ncbi:MAG: sel1 repeat family protein [Methylobacillus sp.]|jgi:hypothetical protein|nr:sel1 repeat family protein [Methylobacillus sp.]